MQSASLDGLQIHTILAPSEFWLRSPVEGLDMPAIRLSEYERPGEDGSSIANQLYGARAIVLVGTINSNNATAHRTARTLLASTCAVRRSTAGVPQPKVFQFTTLSGETYTLNVYVRKLVMPMKDITSSQFMIELTAPDPLIRTLTQSVSTPITRSSGGGFILPVVAPITSSGSTGGSVVINNPGEPTPPIIELVGAMQSPYIANSSAGGKFMQLNVTLGASDRVVIDMAQKTIVLNGASPLMGAKTADSEWWGLLSGSNTISFSTAGTSDTGTMSVKYYPGFLSV